MKFLALSLYGMFYFVMGVLIMRGIGVSDRLGYDATQICGGMLMCAGGIIVAIAVSMAD